MSDTPDYMQIMRDMKPRWQEDGKGLRGDANVVSEARTNSDLFGRLPFEGAKIVSSPPVAAMGADADIPSTSLPLQTINVCFDDGSGTSVNGTMQVQGTTPVASS